ncbi:MAG: SMC family ATPase, partial [Oscillochloris sp.]|nr:SMC family ATPase [Oscillochloris sp.]
KEQREHNQELSTLRARIAAAAELVARREEITCGVAELEAARKELERLEEQRAQHQALENERRELQTQLKDALAELRAALGRLEQRQQQLEKSAARRAKLQSEMRDLDAQILALQPLSLERARVADERHALDLRSEQATDLTRRQDQLEALIKLRYDSLVTVREENQRAIQRLDKQLADAPRWGQERAAARAAAEQIQQEEARLTELRAQEQADVDTVSQQRAECTRLKSAADKLKANQKILADAGGACPVCRSELGTEGIAHVYAHYDEELAALRADYTRTKRQADEGDARVKATRAAAEQLERRLSDLRRTAAQVESLERQLRMADDWCAERVKAQEAHASVEQQIVAREFEPEAQHNLAMVKAELAALGNPTELSRQRKALDTRLREIDERLRERDKAEGLRTARQDELARIERDLEPLATLQAEIAAIQQRIDTGDFAHAVRDQGRQVVAQIEQLGYSPAIHTATGTRARELEHWLKQEQELRLAEQRLAADQELHAKAEQLLAKTAAEAERLTHEDALLEQALRELPRAAAEATAQKEALRQMRGALQVVQKDLGEKQAYLNRAQADADQLAIERANERSMAQRQDLFAELGEAFGKKGVQAMLIETAIPQIEDEANRLLGRMTDNQMHLTIEMQRDTKKGDTVETLEIKIADALGTRVYDAFSGGEAMRANFAVRIALSRLLARRAG